MSSRERTYAHALGFAGEGEGGKDAEGAVSAAHTHGHALRVALDLHSKNKTEISACI